MAGAGPRLENITGIDVELIKFAASCAIKAHKTPKKPFVLEKNPGDSPIALITFPGSWSVNEWWLFSDTDESFGETEIDRELFPSIRSIGVDEAAKVNSAFFKRFTRNLEKLKGKVNNLLEKNKQIVFAGHSSGGPIAILATIWLLEKQRNSNSNGGNNNPPKCLTFGSPLLGNSIVSHALKREKWTNNFFHFVMRYDVVPRIHLAPLPSLQPQLQNILSTISNGPLTKVDAIAAATFFTTVIRNASTVASNEACRLMGNTNHLSDTLTNFFPLSPYRPFGTFIFFTENNKLVILTNPDAVLQILFFSCQLSSEEDSAQIAAKSLKDHWNYDSKMQENWDLLQSVPLDELEKLPLSLTDRRTITVALDELGLSTRALLNVRAAGVYEQKKKKTQEEIEGKKKYIEDRLTLLEEYRTLCRADGLGYYDSFKIQERKKDFEANVKRLELAGVWDEITEKVKRYELPDEFEGTEEWIQLGTRFRRLVEPLDIANYYRHNKNVVSDFYLKPRVRPKRYRYTQKWLEHGEKMTVLSEESTLWAEVEQLLIKTKNKELYFEFEKEMTELEEKMKRWINEIQDDMLLKNSTFMNWWKEIDEKYDRSKSCIMDDVARMKLSSTA